MEGLCWVARIEPGERAKHHIVTFSMPATTQTSNDEAKRATMSSQKRLQQKIDVIAL